VSATTLHDLTFAGLQARLQQDGVRPVHAKALFKAVHFDWQETLAPEGFVPPLQRWMVEHGVPLQKLELLREIHSGDGWTRKFLYGLGDKQEIESVLMGYPGRFTGCISTQVGCAMGCVFCATGQMGFRRHLTAGEIVAQAIYLARYARDAHQDRLRNLVLMGMGEPLHNFDPVMHALDILCDVRGLKLGPSRITISTVGHVPGIRKLAEHPKNYNLAVSLHGSTDEERSALLPINKRWPMAVLREALDYYVEQKGPEQKIFIAWTLIAGKNDTPDHARRILEFVKGLPVHVNLIPLNPTDGFEAEAPEDEPTDVFQKIIQDAGIPATVRQRRGIDVGAGCGQLRSSQGASR
jgi:23S rRNA (adenine2503-C2)-methyltransferase